MQSSTNELKPFALGLFGAACAGLLLGAACRPDLSDDGRPAGPQILASWVPGQSTGPFDDGGGAVIADWKGPPPAWVVGTDALKAAAWTGSATAPLPDRDLEPLPDARELQRIETAADGASEQATDASVDAATDTAALPAPPDADKAQPYDQPLPG